MAEQLDLTRAKATFETLCRTMDGNKWKYQRDDENMLINCGVRGEDLPMDITVRVDAKRSVVMLLSPIPFPIPEEKRLQLAVAISVVNNRLVDGSFDYDIKTGKIYFRLTNSFLSSELGSSVFGYMVAISCRTIDEYNDKFLMMAKGMLSLEQFLAAETN